MGGWLWAEGFWVSAFTACVGVRLFVLMGVCSPMAPNGWSCGTLSPWLFGEYYANFRNDPVRPSTLALASDLWAQVPMPVLTGPHPCRSLQSLQDLQGNLGVGIMITGLQNEGT